LSPIFEEINQATSHENPLYKKAITFHSSWSYIASSSTNIYELYMKGDHFVCIKGI
jgi:hypothetical protein